MCKIQEGRAAGCFPLLFNWILVASPLKYTMELPTLCRRELLSRLPFVPH